MSSRIDNLLYESGSCLQKKIGEEGEPMDPVHKTFLDICSKNGLEGTTRHGGLGGISFSYPGTSSFLYRPCIVLIRTTNGSSIEWTCDGNRSPKGMGVRESRLWAKAMAAISKCMEDLSQEIPGGVVKQ